MSNKKIANLLEQRAFDKNASDCTYAYIAWRSQNKNFRDGLSLRQKRG